MTVDTNIVPGTIVTSTYEGRGPKQYEVLANDGVQYAPDGAIPVRDLADELPLYLYANEIDSIDSTPEPTNPFAELLKQIFPQLADAQPTPQVGVLRNTDTLVEASKLFADSLTLPDVSWEFFDTPGEDREKDRAQFNSAVIWLAARYKQTLTFEYRKVGEAVRKHILEPDSIEPGLNTGYFVFGGEDAMRSDAYRKFRTDRIEGYVSVISVN
jgi:hypothetical protein